MFMFSTIKKCIDRHKVSPCKPLLLKARVRIYLFIWQGSTLQFGTGSSQVIINYILNFKFYVKLKNLLII